MDTSTLHIQQCKDPTKDPQQSFITDANGNPSPSSEFGRLELEKQELERKIHQDPTIKSLKQSYEKNAVVKGEEIYENKTLVLNSELDAVDKVLSRPKKSKVGGGIKKGVAACEHIQAPQRSQEGGGEVGEDGGLAAGQEEQEATNSNERESRCFQQSDQAP